MSDGAPDDPEATALGSALAAEARRVGQRRALVLTGGGDWACRQAGAVLVGAGIETPLWVGNEAPAGTEVVTPEGATDYLGGEWPAVVYDLRAGVDADAMGAVAGTVAAGGLLLLLGPPLADWPTFPDPQRQRITVDPWPPEAVGGRFLRRLADLIAADSATPVWSEGEASPRLPDLPAPPPAAEPPDPDCRTADQAAAVAALEKVATGQRRRPVVLIADRGRGKSAALGIAAARRLDAGAQRVVLTAPRRAAVAAAFERAEVARSGAVREGGSLVWPDRSRLDFRPPDELAESGEQADLVLVDEAAALPVPLLQRLLARYPRLAFATTLHGYEGTGRGFEVRFARALDEGSRGWRRLTLAEPVRWATGDPVEALTFRLLALDAEPPAEAELPPDAAAAAEVAPEDRDALAADETALTEAFGLLVQAHYRTRPRDLRNLLDAPSIGVVTARSGGHVVGVALWAREGGFDAGTAAAITAGRRRPHGHLIPESLAAHLGLGEAPERVGARVLRLAVHPALRRAGLGQRLVEGVAEAAGAAGCDYLGASFAGEPELLAFWRACDLEPVRVSLYPGAISGAHALLMLRPLNDAGSALTIEARAVLADDLPVALGDALRDLDPDLAAAVLAGLPVAVPKDGDARTITAVAAGERLPEARPAPLWRWSAALLAAPPPALEPDGVRVLMARVLQQRPWTEVATAAGLSGRREAVAALRRALRRALAVGL
ncbi:tRNA(Met)-cytidine N(4)-acetyltransferase [Thiohalospira halophila DSM 15071]|uniref:tRNA(Met) cytidine acetyltransferase TmcA n=1 Tax=Thiohalospira halophila DSM 15071 TaxID=1123397 RepID=A0A1I1VL95_9GAMM|nr:GNAT family N-acetyltransferase [Thiohalospira halophila]SFD81320.1 tRNA(Met)-cytidine N(4)-acetyltransferase [Thiohalospira halophila DSM 15071]